MARRPATTSSQTKRREEIISGAAALFDSAGFHSTSMDDIAEKVGIAKPTLYHYYSGKAQILAEIHEEFIATMLSRLRERGERDLSPDDQLLELMVDIFEFIEKRRGHVKVFYEHQNDLQEESRAHVSRLRKEFTGYVSGLVQQCVDTGTFRADVDTTLAARALFGMCNWSYHWFRPRRDDARATAVFMHGVLVRGLQA